MPPNHSPKAVCVASLSVWLLCGARNLACRVRTHANAWCLKRPSYSKARKFWLRFRCSAPLGLNFSPIREDFRTAPPRDCQSTPSKAHNAISSRWPCTTHYRATSCLRPCQRARNPYTRTRIPFVPADAPTSSTLKREFQVIQLAVQYQLQGPGTAGTMSNRQPEGQ